jgi:predicted metal-dependent peptidase
MSDALPPKVLRARLQLMLRHPYLAAALARLPVVNADELGWCETMATDGYTIYFNSAFCAGLSEDALVGVFAHEVLHCVLGHIDRRGPRNRLLWNVAIDHATNLLLKHFGFTLPRVGLFDPRFAGKTAEEIYDIVEKEVVVVEGCVGFDLHLEGGDAEGAAQRRRDYPSPDERRRLRAVVLQELTRELQRRQGTIPGELLREVELASKPQVTWQQLLARFMSGLRRSDYRLFPFNRKHLWRGIYLPSLGVPGPDHLVLAVDTSGSISAKDLGQFVAELDRLRALTECRLTVLHCDAAVQRVEEVPAGNAALFPGRGRVRFAGGGGTDFRPVFDWVADQLRRGQARPDALIFCTDLCGTFPPKAPPYPVVWVVTGPAAQVPFGLVIPLK